MFFPDRIKSIEEDWKVLEIGPGANPFWRSNVYLELNFENEEDAYAQSGHQQPIESEKTVFYDGNSFPFRDNEFDYIICSHVLEHVPNVELFISEINRVGLGQGYIEFPTIYYDYLFNIPEHLNLLKIQPDKIIYCKKESSGLPRFDYLQQAFNFSLFQSYGDIIIPIYKNLFIQGFEWTTELKVERAQVEELGYNQDQLDFLLPILSEKGSSIGLENGFNVFIKELKLFIKKWIKKLI